MSLKNLESQDKNLYPNLQQNRSSQNPYNIVYVPKVNVQANESDDMETPLLGSDHIAFYHPKRAIVYAKESRTNCCCLTTFIICSLCCCFFFITSVVLGGLIGAYASQCGNLSTDELSFSNSPLNLTQIKIVNHNGPISVSTLSDPLAVNITISVKRRANSAQELSSFTSIFYVQNNELYFEEQLPSTNNFWQKVLFCLSAEVDIGIPASLKSGLNIIIATSNGNIDMDTGSSFGSVQVTTSNGNVDLDSFSGDVITSTSSNGNLNIKDLTSRQFLLSTSNGQIKSENGITLTNSSNPSFSASTTNGHIEITQLNTAPGSSINLQTTNGKIDASLSFAGKFSFITTNGDIDIQGANVKYTKNDRSDKEGTANSGSSTSSFKTTNGNIDVTFS